ncbi:SusC/RagA family TonB-linked outer membrane protein [Zobellia alginiliquefaciens]|uniref:SusC/RagA family TonB-linked outer membrane protein n=1 Tax=Zobellia alginiliquefaciens TaxID=3032586 RepID=UPI0023E418D9|nr:TonB-dependent receptor [Zobellia alginiliquefaciens]
MEIKLIYIRSLLRKRILKTIMKLFIFLFSTAVFCLVPENTLSQEKITIEKDRTVSADQVFKIIKKQTDLNFIYPKSLFKGASKIQLTKGEVKVSELIDRVLFKNNLSFELTKNNTILIKKRRLAKPVSKQNQGLRITGQILDEVGVGLPGATIVEVGTTNGTTTDFDGNFSLEVTDENATISISYIGYKTQKLSVGDRTQFKVSMEMDSQGLDEVVIVGYGSKSKKTLTGSVATVEGETLTQTPSANVSANLQGRLPGLIANQRTGQPGSDDPSILIRGAATLNNNNPLVIIDGVPRGNLSRLNPSDIENISVLKDASAAIYGARAANGVILVTTKKGRSGKTEFNLSFDTAISKPTVVPEVLGSVAYAETYNEGEFYAQGRPSANDFTPFYSEADIQKFRDGSDPILYPNTDWAQETLKSMPLQQRFNLSASGGSDKISYLLSYSFLNQEGHYINNPTNYRQHNVRVNVEADLTDNLTMGANLSGIINKKDYSVAGNFVNFYNILRALPTLPARYPNGDIAPGRLGENPLLLDRRGYNRIEQTPLYTTFTATYKVPFVKGLKIDASFNYDQDNHTDRTWTLPYTFSSYNVNTGNYDQRTLGPPTPNLSDRYDKFTTLLYNYRLSYDTKFGDHNVSALVGQEQQQNEHSYVQAYRQNYVSSAIDQLNAGSNAPEDKNNSGTTTASAYNNYFGRFNYDFKSKYLLEFLFRYDGSQIFAEGERYGFFPAVSGGWRLSEEPFIRDNVSFIDNLKLRFSYGELGNDAVGQYQYLQSFSFNNNYVFGSTDVPGVSANTLPNAYITWEKSKKTDIGLEADFLGGLLGTELTFWTENRSDILTSRNLSIPQIVGFPGLPDENIGEVDSKGFEIVLTHQNSIGEDFNYSVNANVAYATSEVVFMDEVPNDEAYQDQTGKPINAGLFYETDGIFNTQEELDAYPHRANSGLGDIKIIDLNEDGEINDLDKFRYDKTDTPEWVFGLNAGINYKNFDMNLFFQGQAGAVNYATRFEDLGTTEPANAFVLRAEDRWTVDNPNGTMPRARHDNPGDNTFFLFDATFVRLKSAEIGYSLPEDVISKIGLGGVRLYVSGSNLLTWAKEIEFTDPEVSGQALFYPQLRVINYGINVNF